MGCSNGRIDVIPEEAKFMSGEEKLLYSNHSVTEVDLLQRKYSYSGKINPNQWRNINRQLNLVQNQTKKPIPHQVLDFYDLFQKDDHFDLQEMLVLSLLLCKGDHETKAKLLFEAFDTSNAKEMSKDSVEKMYKLIHKISVTRAKVLISEIDASDAEQSRYIKKLKTGKKNFQEKFVKTVLGDNEKISAVEFVECFKNSDHGKWLNSSGFRLSLKESNSCDVSSEDSGSLNKDNQVQSNLPNSD